ncbi:MAG: GAF domain-containing protein [Methanomicrobium sp.]|nr:GAF domain-containing protein [Methanomicrobium sp.]
MIYDSKSEDNILTKILEQSYDSASFLFDISKGANVILKESGQIFIANSIFFKMFELEFNVFQKDLFLKDLFEDNENETLEKFLKNRISDPYNSPKTSIFQTILKSGKSMIVILTAIRIPGTNNILVSATEPKKPLEDILEGPENNVYKSDLKKTFSKYLDDEDESRDYAFEKEDSKNYPLNRNDLRNYQLEILNEILISANSSFTLNRMLDNVLNIISTHLGFEINYIYLKNSDGKTANIISAFGTPHFFIESQKNLDVRSWPYNLIFYAGQAKYVENLPDVTISRHDLNILENLGALSYAAIPLISDNTVIGALYTAKAYEGTFTSFEKETLEIIGKEISNIILRGMLQDKLEKECIEARQCFGLILDDINDLNENLMRSVESIKDPKKSLNELAKLMSKDIHENRLIINNLKIIREIGDRSNTQLKKVILDESIRKIIPRYPTIKFKYTDSLYCVYSDEYLPEVFANLINFMLDLGTDSSDIIIEAEAVSDSVILSVESTGPGLSDEEKLLLFSDFDEENIHLDAKSLGLYTAFILLKHYNGRITVADRVAGNRGKGLSFKIGLIRYYDES